MPKSYPAEFALARLFRWVVPVGQSLRDAYELGMSAELARAKQRNRRTWP
jgi:hypothetical protein